MADGSTAARGDLAGDAELICREGGNTLLTRTIRYVEDRRRAEDRYTGAIETHPSPLGVIWGSEDPIAVREMASRVVERRPDATLCVLEGVGHYPMLEAPIDFVAAVSRMLGAGLKAGPNSGDVRKYPRARSAPRRPARHRAVTLYARFASDLANGLDQLGVPIDETDTVVGRVPVGQLAGRYQSLKQRATLGFRVVVDAVRVRNQGQAVGHRSEIWPERIRRATDVPAQRPGGHTGQDHTCSPDLLEDRVESVYSPHSKQVRHAASADPDHVLFDQEARDITDTRHREQVEVDHVDACRSPGFVQPGVEESLVTVRSPEMTEPGRPAAHSGQLDRVEYQGGEGQIGVRTPFGPPGGRENRRHVS